jgi:hypothetical protein
MADSRRKSDSTVVFESSSEPDPAVSDALKAVDTSALETLLEIRTEQTRIAEYHARAEQLKDKASDEVWRHVVADYTAREAALTARAAALVTQVRIEYRKVQALLDRIQTAGAAARLERQELEFRHLVGELSDDDLAPRVRAPDGVIAQCDGDLALVHVHQARFVEALGPDKPVEPTPAALPAPVGAKPGGPPPAAPPLATPSPHEGMTVMAPSPVQNAAAAAPTPIAAPAPAPPPQPPKAPPLSSGPPSGAMKADVTVPVPRMAPRDGAAPPPSMLTVMGEVGTLGEHRLGAINNIGRSPDNQIQMGHAGVSRHHATVKANGATFVLTDLGSQNGTFVNGIRVTEHVLADGDHIGIGDAQVIYRILGTGPAAGGAKTL